MNRNNSMGDPFRRNKMQSYFKFSLIAFAAVMFVGIAIYFFGQKQENVDYSKADFIQFRTPEDSATVVVFETTEGTIKAVLYEKEAPKYAEYFKDLVKDGYFDDTYVCSIFHYKDREGSSGFIMGSKTTDGVSNKESNTKTVNIELSSNLLPTKGALGSYVKDGGWFTKAKAGSVITVFGDSVDMNELKDTKVDDVNGLYSVRDLFAKYGGVFAGIKYTLFGQIYDGWEAFDKINATRIIGEDKEDDDKDKSYQPEREIKIIKAYLSTYGEQKQNGFNIPQRSDYDPDLFKNSDSTSSSENK